MTWGNQYAMSHTVIERFLRFVEIDADACWRWRGYVMRTPHGNGYGKFNNLLAHRVAYSCSSATSASAVTCTIAAASPTA